MRYNRDQMMSAVEAARLTKNPLELVERLFTRDGITVEELESEISISLDLDPSSPQVSVYRMNFLGSLRAQGYIIEKGRRRPQKILDWKPIPEYASADRWEGQEREVIDEFESSRRLELKDADEVEESLEKTSLTLPQTTAFHEQCFGYIWAYELARDQAVWYTSNEGSALIMRRFVSYPRFRVFNLNLNPQSLVSLAAKYSQASMVPVRILNAPPEFSSTPPPTRGWVSYRREAVYRAEDIASRPEDFFNSRAMTTLRKNAREVTYLTRASSIDTTTEDRVIGLWRQANEPKQRQLAITRDFVATRDLRREEIDFHFLGMRGVDPCCLHILSRIPGHEDTVAQIVEKSLNYGSLPGGKYGTADYNLYQTCVELLKQGVKKINAGGYDGGGQGLPEHKERFARGSDDVFSRSFQVAFPHFNREKYRKEV